MHIHVHTCMYMHLCIILCSIPGSLGPGRGGTVCSWGDRERKTSRAVWAIQEKLQDAGHRWGCWADDKNSLCLYKLVMKHDTIPWYLILYTCTNVYHTHLGRSFLGVWSVLVCNETSTMLWLAYLHSCTCGWALTLQTICTFEVL